MAHFWNRIRKDIPPGAGMKLEPTSTGVICPKCKTEHSGSEATQKHYICPTLKI